MTHLPIEPGSHARPQSAAAVAVVSLFTTLLEQWNECPARDVKERGAWP